MKKWFALALVAVLSILAVATAVYAQTPTPQNTPQPYGRGQGMMGGQRGAMMNGVVDGDEGPLHDGMIAFFAGKLGLTSADLEARLAKGETMLQIAESKGITGDAFTALMNDARNAGIDAAVKAGTLTQEQADWMKQRGTNGAAMGGRGQGMRGQNGANLENCPMTDGTTTTAPQSGTFQGRGGMGGRGMMGRGTTQP